MLPGKNMLNVTKGFSCRVYTKKKKFWAARDPPAVLIVLKLLLDVSADFATCLVQNFPS